MRAYPTFPATLSNIYDFDRKTGTKAKAKTKKKEERTLTFAEQLVPSDG